MGDIELLEQLALHEAKGNFWAYRQYINGGGRRPMKRGWYQRRVAHDLQQFYSDMVAGLRPKLAIKTPPQHGKSFQVIDFVTWALGHNPDLRCMFTSFSDRLGVRANLRTQRILESEKYRKTFPDTRIGRETQATSSRRAQRTTSLVEMLGREGSFRNTTVKGAITGEGLDLGIIDDPIKGREAAGSQNNRDKVWEWFTDDFFTRFADEAGLILIMTPWHVDDPGERMAKAFPDMKILNFPALAEEGADLMPDDPRAPGSEDALFPELKSKDFLLERRQLMAAPNWASLYRMKPQLLGGNLIKGQWFFRWAVAPKILYRKIYVDTAQKTKEANDYSVFECWGKGDDGKIYLLDMIRGKWEAPELRQQARDFWNKQKAVQGQGALRAMHVEDKVSGTGLIQDMRRADKIPVVAVQRNTDKLTRAMDVIDYISSGYVGIPENADFASAFITEAEEFSADMSHKYDDQMDPMFDAIKDMLATKEKGFFDVG